MDIKTGDGRKSGRKQDDVKPETSSDGDPGTPALSIAGRKAMGSGEGAQPSEVTSDATQAEPVEESSKAPAKRVIIKPLSAAADEARTSEPAAGTPKSTEPVKAHDPSDGPDPSASQPADAAERSSEDTLTKSDSDKIQQDVEAAQAEAAKRDQELQQYIDEHRFFVPIDAVAHRRSVLNSARLTLLLFLLSLFLINLMLDAGLILLLEKIPHTNFFGNN